MISKIFRLARNSFIAILWGLVFLSLADSVLIRFWNFSLLSSQSWDTVNYFWQAGGVIKEAKDYLFVFVLFSVPILYFLGWKCLIKQNYLNFLLFPYNLYYKRSAKKHNTNSISIKAKNLPENNLEAIKEQINSIKPEKAQAVNKIRKQVQKKVNSSNKAGG